MFRNDVAMVMTVCGAGRNAQERRSLMAWEILYKKKKNILAKCFIKRRKDMCMSLGRIKANKLSMALLTVVGAIFYLMNVYTPFYVDDWHYCSFLGTTPRISSVSDLFVSQFRHFFVHNSRMVPHLFIHFFDGLTGKPLFNAANAVMLVLFLHLLVITATRAKGQYYKTLTLAAAFTMLLMPGFKLAFLWMCGACNYLWMGVLLLSFNILLQKDIQGGG